MAEINYNMGAINVGGTPTPATKQDLNAFNQSMVNAKSTIPTPSTFTGVTSNTGFVGTPTVVSNYNTPTKVAEITKKAETLIGQPLATRPQVQTTDTIKDYTNAPYSTRDGQNYFYNDQTQAYDIPDVGPNTGLLAGDPYSLAMAKNIEDARKKNDQALASALEGIKNRFEQYRTTQRNVTESGASGARNALLQSEGGSRGSVAQFAAATADRRVESIMADGQKALQELDNKEKELISATQAAYAQDDFKYVSQLNSQIEKLRTEKLEKSRKVNELLAAEQVKADTVKKQVDAENTLSEIYGTGITDPAQIQRELKARGITSMTLKDINDSVSLLSGIGGTGIIGEYNFAKAKGYQGSFSEYQNEDANRKIQVAAASQNPDRLLSAIEAQALGVPFGTTAQQAYGKTVQKQPTEGQWTTSIYAKRIVDSNPTIDTLQNIIVNMNPASYSWQKSLEDTTIGNTMVSDEMKQYRQAQRNFINAVLRRESGAVISPTEFTNAEKQYFPMPGDDATTLAQKKQNRDTVQNQFIKMSGTAFGAEDTIPSIGEQAAQTEEQAQTSLQSFIKTNPDKGVEVQSRIKIMETQLGRPINSVEFLQAFPEYKGQSFNTVVGDTNLSQGVVGGVNLKGYAVDPNQIKSVATIYNKVPDSDNALDFTKFIKSISPNSPIKGEDILYVADTYKLDPKILIALMQHESMMGTSSVARANNNYGGITWSESYSRNNPGAMKGTPRPKNEGGYYVKFATPREGLIAQAKLLNNRKIA